MTPSGSPLVVCGVGVCMCGVCGWVGVCVLGWVVCVCGVHPLPGDQVIHYISYQHSSIAPTVAMVTVGLL